MNTDDDERIHPPTGPTPPGEFIPRSAEELDAVLDAYDFIEIIGRGGMGAVYQARQPKLDRVVAIKVLPPLGDDGDDGGMNYAERFLREARSMAQLSHPNILHVYDFGETSDGQLYFVMEYVEGTDLHELIKGGQLTSDHVLGWIPRVCDALQYAHAHGIVHRDIKPGNIMISTAGEVKVADFGLAKVGEHDSESTRLTMTNVAMGTPDYVAPETLTQGMETDHRADIYALGVLLYEMLTGAVPRGAWKPPSIKNPMLDPRFDSVVLRAMEENRDERFQQAGEISTALHRIRTEPRPQDTPDTPAPQAPVVKKKRRPLLVTGPVHAKAAPPGSSPAGRPSRGATAPVRPAGHPPKGATAPVRPAAGKSGPGGGAGVWIGLAAGLALLGIVGGILFFGGDDEASGSNGISTSRMVKASETGGQAGDNTRGAGAVKVPPAPAESGPYKAIGDQLAAEVEKAEKVEKEAKPVANADGWIDVLAMVGTEFHPKCKRNSDGSIEAEGPMGSALDTGLRESEFHQIEVVVTRLSGTDGQLFFNLPVEGKSWALNFGGGVPANVRQVATSSGTPREFEINETHTVLVEVQPEGKTKRLVRLTIDGQLAFEETAEVAAVNAAIKQGTDTLGFGVGGGRSRFRFDVLRVRKNPVHGDRSTHSLTSVSSGTSAHRYEVGPIELQSLEEFAEILDRKTLKNEDGATIEVVNVNGKPETTYRYRGKVEKHEWTIEAKEGGGFQFRVSSKHAYTVEALKDRRIQLTHVSNPRYNYILTEPIDFSSPITTWSSERNPDEGWIDVLSMVDLEEGVVQEHGGANIKKNPDGSLEALGGAGQAVYVALPSPGVDNYQVRGVFTQIQKQTDWRFLRSGFLFFPVGVHNGYVAFGAGIGGHYSQDGSLVRFNHIDFESNLGRPVEFLFEYQRTGNGTAKFTFFIEGKTIVEWVGDPKFLTDHNWHCPPTGFGFGFADKVSAKFSSLEVRSMTDEPLAFAPKPPPPQSEVDRRLSVVETQFRERYRAGVLADHAKRVEALNQQYLGALDRAEDAASRAANLDEVLVIQAEKKRVEAGEALPDTDEPETPASVGNLRETYRTQIGRLETRREAGVKELAVEYDKALDGLQRDFTGEARIEEALRVKAVREAVKGGDREWLEEGEASGIQPQKSAGKANLPDIFASEKNVHQFLIGKTYVQEDGTTVKFVSGSEISQILRGNGERRNLTWSVDLNEKLIVMDHHGRKYPFSLSPDGRQLLKNDAVAWKLVEHLLPTMKEELARWLVGTTWRKTKGAAIGSRFVFEDQGKVTYHLVDGDVRGFVCEVETEAKFHLTRDDGSSARYHYILDADGMRFREASGATEYVFVSRSPEANGNRVSVPPSGAAGGAALVAGAKFSPPRRGKLRGFGKTYYNEVEPLLEEMDRRFKRTLDVVDIRADQQLFSVLLADGDLLTLPPRWAHEPDERIRAIATTGNASIRLTRDGKLYRSGEEIAIPAGLPPLAEARTTSKGNWFLCEDGSLHFQMAGSEGAVSRSGGATAIEVDPGRGHCRVLHADGEVKLLFPEGEGKIPEGCADVRRIAGAHALTGDGRVFVIGVGRQPPPEIQGQVVQIFRGGAARTRDGKFVYWGIDARGIKEKIESFGPEVVDMAVYSLGERAAYVVWIEAEN